MHDDNEKLAQRYIALADANKENAEFALPAQAEQLLIKRLEGLEKNPETGVKWRDIRRVK